MQGYFRWLLCPSFFLLPHFILCPKEKSFSYAPYQLCLIIRKRIHYAHYYALSYDRNLCSSLLPDYGLLSYRHVTGADYAIEQTFVLLYKQTFMTLDRINMHYCYYCCESFSLINVTLARDSIPTSLRDLHHLHTHHQYFGPCHQNQQQDPLLLP